MKYQFPISALLLAALSSASAQLVTSHPPSTALTPPSAAVVADKPLVRVNGAVLTEHDLQREMYAMFPYARQHNGGIPKTMEPEIRQGAAKMLIFEELVYQEAKRRKMVVPREQLVRALAEFRKQFGSQEEYQQFVQQELHGDQKLLQAKVERSILIDKLLKLEVTGKAVVSLAEAKAYFDKHPDRFRTPETFSLQSVSIMPPANATPAQLKEAHKRAEDALRQAKATKSYEEFGLLAEKISDDSFRVMMGDHKAADRDKLPPPVVNAALAMQPGQVSDIVEFDKNAFTILRLNAHTAAGMKTFAAVKDELREQLKKEKAEQLRSALAAKLSKTAKIEKL
jgi:peptidyl-prolyl cis-trans isomerase SurA